jgi:hypothetical protein
VLNRWPSWRDATGDGIDRALACGVSYVLTLRLTVYEGQRMSPDPTGDEIGAWDSAAEPKSDPP